MLAYIVYPFKTPEIFIGWTYTDPKERVLCKELLQRVEDWAKKIRVKKISAMVRKNLEAFNKKYGFKLDSHLVTKELEEVK